MVSAFTEVSSTRSYLTLLQEQSEKSEKLKTNSGPSGFLLAELDPVITYTARTPTPDIWAPNSVPRLLVDRGGLATYHGPGQWVLFPVQNVLQWTGEHPGVRRSVDLLLQIAVEVALNFGVSVEKRSGKETGVWSANGKIASVGIRIRSGMIQHGLSINGYRTPLSFQGLNPCGLSESVDYLIEDQSQFEPLGQAIFKAALHLSS